MLSVLAVHERLTCEVETAVALRLVGAEGAAVSGMKVTVAFADAVPPAPVHVIVYVVVTIGETLTDPETPDGVNPLPVQLVALVEDHESVDDCPAMTDVGDAERETVGVGMVTVTVAFADAVPPAPVQVTVYVVVMEGVTLIEPDTPDGVKLVPVHDVAFVEFHVSVLEPPRVTEVGAAETEAVGAGGVTVIVVDDATKVVAEL